MSTDRKRLTSAIQRIAREDPEIRKLLEDFRNSGGFPSASATSESGDDDRGSDKKDPSDGGQYAGGQDAGDGLDPDDPADLSEMGPGSLTGVHDCATGEPVCFDGADWIPPEGWDGPQDPGPAEGFVEGVYWFARGRNETLNEDWSVGRFATCFAARAFVISVTDPCILPYLTPCRYAGGAGWCPDHPDGLEDSFEWTTWDRNCDSESTLDACQYTTENPPLADSWPEDGCVNLATKGGKIVGSKYDPENDGSYSAPRDSIELCDDFGNSFELKPSASGGWKSISASNPGDGYLYNSKGEQIARISGSEFSDPNV